MPTIWTDWLHRLDAKIAIVGQDWGPISEIKRFSKLYTDTLKNHSKETIKEKIWQQLVRKPDGRTTRRMIHFLRMSAEQTGLHLPTNFMDELFVTNAVLCARQGNRYRGNENYAPKASTNNCRQYLRRQIEIVKPAVVITLGAWSLWSFSQFMDFEFHGKLTSKIESVNNTPPGYIKADLNGDRLAIVPVFHPAAIVSTEMHLRTYSYVWQALSDILNIPHDKLIQTCFPVSSQESDAFSNAVPTQ